MAKQEPIQQEGVVTEALPNAQFRVELDNGHTILGLLSGKMRKYFIRILPGARVDVEMSSYDWTKGRIVDRYKYDVGYMLGCRAARGSRRGMRLFGDVACYVRVT